MVTFEYGSSSPKLEDRREHIWYYKKLIEASKNKEIQIYTSYLTMNECLFIKDEKDQLIINDEVKRLFNSIIISGISGIIPILPERRILHDARNLRWEYEINLDPYDSLHIASALKMKCKEFITTDSKSMDRGDNFIKLENLGLKIIESPDTKLLPPEYKQVNAIRELENNERKKEKTKRETNNLASS